MDDSEAPPVPDSVFEDVEQHPDLVKRWVTDREFREEVVRSDDPATTAEQLMDISLHENTKDWINERVRVRTPDGLLEFRRPIPF